MKKVHWDRSDGGFYDYACKAAKQAFYLPHSVKTEIFNLIIPKHRCRHCNRKYKESKQ